MTTTAINTRITSYHESVARRVDLYITDCASCGVVFAVTVELEGNRRRDGGTFCCPNGHSMVFRETTADAERKRAERAEREQERLNRRLANAQEDARAAHASLVATKGHLTRVRRRADRGVCQHCSRSFVNVARHVAGQHPEIGS